MSALIFGASLQALNVGATWNCSHLFAHERETVQQNKGEPGFNQGKDAAFDSFIIAVVELHR
jgi:hypothetical protein